MNVYREISEEIFEGTSMAQVFSMYILWCSRSWVQSLAGPFVVNQFGINFDEAYLIPNLIGSIYRFKFQGKGGGLV